MEKLNHWTTKSTADFVYRISSDFVGQLELRMECFGTTRTELAERLKVTIGRVSQVLNDPGNLTLKNTVSYAGALGMKVAIVAYQDASDPNNEKGPVNAEIFHECWRRAGSPRDFFQLNNSSQHSAMYQMGGSGAYPNYGAYVWYPDRAENGTGIRPPASFDSGRIAGQLVQ